MTTIEIKNLGPVKEVNNVSLGKVNVFTGIGKSTVAKIISFCRVVERDIVMSASLEKYQKNKGLFREYLETLYKMKGYFKPNSYIHYRSSVVDITWENNECSMSWVDQDSYKYKRVAYIPAERNMIVLPEARRSELGDTYLRRFLFDWFHAREKFTYDQPLQILNTGSNYYYGEGVVEDYIKGDGYEIPLENASSGLHSLTPMMAVVKYLTKWIYEDDIACFEGLERLQSLIMSTVDVDSEELDIDSAFNGLKSTVNRVFTVSGFSLVIEEPELGISENVQKDLIKYLLGKCSEKGDSDLILTTNVLKEVNLEDINVYNL